MYEYLLKEWSVVTLESVVCNKRINSSLLMNLQFITQELKNPYIGIGFALKFNIGIDTGSNFGIGTSLLMM